MAGSLVPFFALAAITRLLTCIRFTGPAFVASPMRLQPWGRLDGLFLVGGKPVADRQLTIRTKPRGLDNFALQLDAFRTESDAEGRFTFPQVPPGKFELVRLIKLPRLRQAGAINSMTWRPS